MRSCTEPFAGTLLLAYWRTGASACQRDHANRRTRRLARRGFVRPAVRVRLEGAPVPSHQVGRRAVGELKEVHHRPVRVLPMAGELVRQQILPQPGVIEDTSGTSCGVGKPDRFWIRVGVERPLGRAAGPKSATAQLVGVPPSITQSPQFGAPTGCRGARRPENRVHARSKEPQKSARQNHHRLTDTGPWARTARLRNPTRRPWLKARQWSGELGCLPR
jgi:hypothetical protein